MLELVLQGTFIWPPMWHWWKPLVEHWLQGAVVFSGGWSRSIRLGDTLRTRGIFEKRTFSSCLGFGETWCFTHAHMQRHRMKYTFRICRLRYGYTNIRHDMFRTRRRSKPKAPPNKPPAISITVEASSWVSLFLGLISTGEFYLCHFSSFMLLKKNLRGYSHWETWAGWLVMFC